MDNVFCGIDFGTSNSCVALSSGDRVEVLPIDPLNDPATCLPSLLYLSAEGERIVGRSAANAFIDRNVDREVVLKQVDLGITIEGYVGAEPDKSEGYRPREDGYNAPESVRARATIEVTSPAWPICGTSRTCSTACASTETASAPACRIGCCPAAATMRRRAAPTAHRGGLGRR